MECSGKCCWGAVGPQPWHFPSLSGLLLSGLGLCSDTVVFCRAEGLQMSCCSCDKRTDTGGWWFISFCWEMPVEALQFLLDELTETSNCIYIDTWQVTKWLSDLLCFSWVIWGILPWAGSGPITHTRVWFSYWVVTLHKFDYGWSL